VLLSQVARLEQRVLAKEAEHEATTAALEEARAERESVRLASAAQMDNLAALPRQRWPRAVQLLVEEAEAAKEAEVQEKLVRKERRLLLLLLQLYHHQGMSPLHVLLRLLDMLAGVKK
jgi:precorrin-6B methylase 1